MKNNYPYLRDPRAVSEIRKHQWIESQKAGREIGFGSAATDWMRRFGPAWRDAHAIESQDRTIFLEQRKFRRFHLHSSVQLIRAGEIFPARTVDVSSRGVLCRIPARFIPGEQVSIRWLAGLSASRALEYHGVVERISDAGDARGEYLLLVKFSEESRSRIEKFSFLHTS